MDKMPQIEVHADTTPTIQEQKRDKSDELVKNHEGSGGIYEAIVLKPSRVRGKPQVDHVETVECLKMHLKRGVADVRFANGGQGVASLQNLTFCRDAEKIKAFRQTCKDPFNTNERVVLTNPGIQHVFNSLSGEFFVTEAELRQLIINAMDQGKDKGFKVVGVLGEEISIEVPIALPHASSKTRMDIKKVRVPIAFTAVSYLVAERIKK